MYCNGDGVYFKRLSADTWHGPAKVLGKDGLMYLLKQGGLYVCVHPCRMSPVNPPDSDQQESGPFPVSEPVASASPQISANIIQSDVDSDDDSNDVTQEEIANDNDSSISSVNHDELHHGPATAPDELPKIKDTICYRLCGNSSWETGQVISRGGKVGGRHWHFLNIKSSADGAVTPVSFRDGVEKWMNVADLPLPDQQNGQSNHDESFFVYLGKHTSCDKFVKAKLEEINKWKQMCIRRLSIPVIPCQPGGCAQKKSKVVM